MILALLALAFVQAADPAVPAASPDPTPAPAAAAAAAPAGGEVPAGAPTDDYGLVAWCRGALTGHMELYKAVKVEMQRVEAEKAARTNAKLSGAALQAAKARQVREAKQSDEEDAAQLKAGREYIQLYGQALDAAEASAPQSLHLRGQQEIENGYKIWSAARAANPRDRMWSWLMWELPARCETAAKRLKSNAGLFGDAYKSGEQAQAPASASPAAAAPADAQPDPAPAPAADAPTSQSPPAR